MIIFTYWSPWRKMPLKVGVLGTQGSFAGTDNGGFGSTAHFIWVLLAFLSFAFTEDFPCLCASSTTNRALQEENSFYKLRALKICTLLNINIK